MNIIEVSELKKTFVSPIKRKKVKALQGVDFQVPKGEIFGLLGPNGAGKTTLVKILLGICYKSGGSARLFGEESSHARSRDRAGYLPESHKYPPYLKGQDVIDYYARLSGMSGGARREAIDRLLKMVRMDDWRKEKMGKYSKGMQQRVGLAVAMVSDPDLLVLDEPTDGVDPLGRKEIRDILLELKERGKTIFLNSHLLGEVELICDRVAVINKGRVVTIGSVDELTDGGNAWVIELDEIPDGYIKTLNDRDITARLAKAENEILIEAEDLAELNTMLDGIRSDGCLIAALRRQRQTLEDMFIDVITSEGEASVR